MIDGRTYEGEVFSKSTIEKIKIPSTLKIIEEGTFSECENLKEIEFSEGLEKIGLLAFKKIAIENVIFPASLRTIA